MKAIEGIEKLLNQQINKLHIRRTNDFLDRVTQISLHQQCTDIQLECQGYSLFYPQQVFKNFIDYFNGLYQYVEEKNKIIYTLKLTFNGFKVERNYIQKIQDIIKKFQQNLKILWINTNDLENVDLEDFEKLFKLMIGQGIKNQNFEDFSLQCSNWVFKDRQPNSKELMKAFEGLVKDSFNQNGQRVNQGMGGQLYQKHIRLEISGWWYRAAEAKIFLGFMPEKNDLKEIPKNNQQNYQAGRMFSKQQFSTQVEIFHTAMFLMISKILEIMQNIQHLEIDMRNAHELLQMKKLKERIISGVSKTNRIEKSIISMRHAQNQNAEEDKTLRLNIMM